MTWFWFADQCPLWLAALALGCAPISRGQVVRDLAPIELTAATALPTFLDSWRKDLYWKGLPPGYSVGRRIRVMLFFDQESAGICARALGLCVVYPFGRGLDGRASGGNRLFVKAANEREMFELTLGKPSLALRPELDPVRPPDPQAAIPIVPALPSIPMNRGTVTSETDWRLDRFRLQFVELTLPAPKAPTAADLPPSETRRNELSQSLLHLMHGLDRDCEVLLPYMSARDEVAYVGTRCHEARRVWTFIVWHTGEWRMAEQKTGEQAKLQFSRIEAATWLRIRSADLK